MPVYGGSSASGKQRKRKRRKDSGTGNIPNAITGGKGVKKTERARKSYDRARKRRDLREKAAGLNVPTKQFGARTPTKILKSQVQNAARTQRLIDRATRKYEKENGPPGIVERGLIGSAVYEATGTDISDEVRSALYGSENPSAEAILASAIPATRIGKTVGRLGKAVSGGSKAAPKLTKAQRLRSKASAAERAGKSRKANRARRGEARAAGRVETKRRRNQEKLDRALAGETGVKNKIKRTWKSKQPAVLTKPGRKVKRRNRAYGISAIGAGGAAAYAPVAAQTIGTTGEAIKEDIEEGKPLRTVGTTVRALQAMPGALAADATDLAAWVGGDEEAGERWVKSQEQYYRQFAKVAKGGEAGVEAVQEDVGLMPVITGALGVTGAGKALGGVSRPDGIRVRRVNRLDRKAREAGTDKERAAYENKRDRLGAGYSRSKQERTEEAKRAAATAERTERLSDEDMRIAGRGRKQLDRRLVRLSRRPITKDVSQADLVQFLGREGLYGEDVDFIVSEVRKRRAALKESSRPIKESTTSTRQVMDAILDNPEILRSADLRTVIEDFGKLGVQRSTERHAERLGERQTTPDPVDDRARYLHMAEAEGKLLPEERELPSLEGRTDVSPRKGQDFEDAVRAEANDYRRKANRLKAQASSHPRNSTKRKELLEASSMAKLEAKARFAVVNRAKQAEALDRLATRIERGEVRLPDKPDELRAAAARWRREVEADNAALREEFRSDMDEVVAGKPYEEPVWFKELDARDEGDLNLARDYMGGQIPPKEKLRTGELARQGAIDERASTLLETTYRTRFAAELRGHVRSFLKHRLWNEDGKGEARTGAEWRRLEKAGMLPPGMALFPVQEWKRVLQRGSWEEAQDILDNETMRSVRIAEGADGKKYGLVPAAAKAEFRAQLDGPSKLIKRLRLSARVQSALMLGTSPLWFAFQFPATMFATAMRHPNPVKWVKVGAQMARQWRETPKRERIAFQSEFGGTSADVFDMRDTQLALMPATSRMAAAARVSAATPAGRFLTHIKKGGPFIAANRKFEANWRTFVAMLEADQRINPSRAKRFVQSAAGVYETTYRHLQHLQGKPESEVVRFYNDNPAEMRELRDGIDDANGSWNALTSRERAASALLVFYPFVRFSNRWAFVSMPKHRPVLYAAALNLAQQNAQELDAMGDPGFFSEWGQGVTHTDEDDPTLINLARIAPGGNVLTEIVGGAEGITPASLLRATQPLIGGTILAGFGQTPYGSESDVPFLDQSLKNALSLSGFTRPLANELDPRSEISEAFRALKGEAGETFLQSLLGPNVLNSASEFKATSELGDLLEATTNRPTGNEGYENPDITPAEVKALRRREVAGDKAQLDIDRLLKELGLTTPSEQRRIKRVGGKTRSKIKYGPSSSSSDVGSAYDAIFGSGSSGGGGGAGGAYERVFE